MMSLLNRTRDERGVAMPMALIALALMLSLMISFAVLAGTDPLIADNHLKSVQARSLAESGVERALWALTHPSETGGIPASPTTAVTPYDGSAFFALTNTGGFTVKVETGGASNERAVTAVGWTPDNNTSDPTPKGVRTVTATVMKIRTVDPPCAICVMGNLQVAGNTTVDARGGACAGGPAPNSGSLTTGVTTTGAAGKVYGPGDDTYNQVSPVGNDIINDPTNTFTFKYTEAELDTLKAIAQRNGTYYQGAVTSLPASGGIVFIDTTTGNPFTSSTPDTEAGSLALTGSTTFSGWIIVRGSVSLGGATSLTGLVYAQNDLNATGNTSITGAVVTENKKDISSTNIDSAADGNTTITYNCTAVRDGGGTVSQGWFVKAGTYKEISR